MLANRRGRVGDHQAAGGRDPAARLAARPVVSGAAVVPGSQLRDALCRRLRAGEFTDALPTEQALQVQYSVSRHTSATPT